MNVKNCMYIILHSEAQMSNTLKNTFLTGGRLKTDAVLYFYLNILESYSSKLPVWWAGRWWNKALCDKLRFYVRGRTGLDDNDSLIIPPNLSLSPYISSALWPLFAVVMASPQRFQGNSLLQWNNMAAAAGSVPWHVELMFRTRQASATLLHISSGLQHNLTLQVIILGHLGLDSAILQSMHRNVSLFSRGRKRNISKECSVICHLIWWAKTWTLTWSLRQIQHDRIEAPPVGHLCHSNVSEYQRTLTQNPADQPLIVTFSAKSLTAFCARLDQRLSDIT